MRSIWSEPPSELCSMLWDPHYPCMANPHVTLSYLNIISVLFIRLKNSDTHSELTTLLIGTFLRLRQSSQSIATESLHYEPIREEDNSSVLVVLQQAVADLNLFAKVPENRIHILVIKETSIIAIYSG